jgi:hypothetical protein
MWTDINTKPKQGAVFLAIRGHVMGIPADYNDASFATKCNFRPPSWVSKPVSMLSIPRDQVAAQECVGKRVTNKGVEIWDQNPYEGHTGSVCCRQGGTSDCRANQTWCTSSCTNQDGERTCLEPGDLQGTEATGEKPRCSMGEGIYSPSHF